jgi:hypothetical protein
MDFEDNVDRVVAAPLTERVVVYWSKPRCWHGDNVYIRVRTERVIDGSTIELSVFAQGQPAHFDRPPNQNITNNRLDFDYRLDWKTALPAPPYPTQVEVTARVVQLNLTSARSPVMHVDLIPPLFSA